MDKRHFIIAALFILFSFATISAAFADPLDNHAAIDDCEFLANIYSICVDSLSDLCVPTPPAGLSGEALKKWLKEWHEQHQAWCIDLGEICQKIDKLWQSECKSSH